MAVIRQNAMTIKNKSNGNGEISVTPLLAPDNMTGSCGMFAKVVVPVGASIGVHQHTGSNETYVVLSGSASYNDNGELLEIHSGDVVFCEDDGKHGIKNIGNDSLVFIALIVNTK